MAKQIKKTDTPNLTQMLTSALLGEAIKARRTQSKLRIEDAAALCGVAKQTFMKIEHGQQTARPPCSELPRTSVYNTSGGLGKAKAALPTGKLLFRKLKATSPSWRASYGQR